MNKSFKTLKETRLRARIVATALLAGITIFSDERSVAQTARVYAVGVSGCLELMIS